MNEMLNLINVKNNFSRKRRKRRKLLPTLAFRTKLTFQFVNPAIQ